MTMVESSLDRWRKDVFFSAAEEVQESADIMESVYRAWERLHKGGNHIDKLDALYRELRIALDTTKWQLEEFERAVKLSHESCSPKHTIVRHTEFVVAIEDQVSRIEKALRDSLIEKGKQPLPWVHLDEKECDDLALFLSGPPCSSHNLDNAKVGIPMEIVSHREDADHSVPETNWHKHIKGFKEIVTINNDSKYVVEFEAKEFPEATGEIHERRVGSDELNTCNSQDMTSWRIVISNEDELKKPQEDAIITLNHSYNLCSAVNSIESAVKLKWFQKNLRNEKDGGHLELGQASNCCNLRRMSPLTRVTNVFNGGSRNCFSNCKKHFILSQFRRLFGRIGGFKPRVQGSKYYLKFSLSIQISLALMLPILLIAPFIVHAS